MFVLQFEYGFGGEGHTESCVEFDTMDEAREFALAAVNEICDKIQNGLEADNAILRVWDAETDDVLIYDI